MPTVCTASGSIPVAEVTTCATSLVVTVWPSLGWNTRVVPPAKSIPNWKPRKMINRMDATTSVDETM